jgi:hypothetical protein
LGPTRIPGIEYAAMPRSGAVAAGLAWPPRWIVIHDTGNNQSNRYSEARYAATRTDAQAYWTSAHVYVDRGGALGSLPLTLRAWAAYAEANAHGVHIEMCRESNGVVHPDTIRHTTAVVRTLLQLGAGAPVKLSPADVAASKRGICGHRDITLGLHVGDHEDPGANFDWAGFMAQVSPAVAPDTRDEDDMGGFAKLDLEQGNTNIAVPGGALGWKSPTYLAVCNDTFGVSYGLRIYTTTGDGSWTPIDADGLVLCESGHVYGFPLPEETRCVSIVRAGVRGTVVYDPTLPPPPPPTPGQPQPLPPPAPYAGHLSVALER